MRLNEIMDEVINGKNVTELKKEFAKLVENMSNEDFMAIFDYLYELSMDENCCCCEWDCDDECSCGDDCHCDEACHCECCEE